ncbi:SRPBCC family protein [Mycolicibacterium komossense]|uniref:SRPBCC domain-containing protein n=1 Tax=Mycolicibacterium komossense TaxID=1779 RepID=A0ABT3CKU9_9MYCO|nr:SRPBCC domain-containing protein [Mycolicibacterium komossense]MCV7230045.1 SRPBCC domain-containing protein [Mycolicibacterium komossense]
MSEIATDPAIIDVEQFYEVAKERVWQALTTPELMARWLLEPKGFRPVVGTDFAFTGIDALADLGFEGACRVIAVRSNELLSIGWTNAESDLPGGWVVTWLLHPEGHGTRVILRHKGFDPHDEAEQEARRTLGRGWVTVAARLGEVLGL